MAATTSGHDDVATQLDGHRGELIGYCYRMLGSAFEAEDAVQETMVRAWRNFDGFEGRSSLRSWLYRIATNVCLDMLPAPQRRARPMDLGAPGSALAAIPAVSPESTWITPIADHLVVGAGDDPAEVAATRDSIRLAFVAALAHLPPRQRAVLILRDVLRWHADEVAGLLDTSVVSVNSALQRARATLAGLELQDRHPQSVDDDQRGLLTDYVDAFERYDIDRLVTLLRDDVVMSMPPFPLWLEGPQEVATWFTGHGSGCRGSRLVPTAANGSAAFGSYRADPAGGHAPWAVHVIEVADRRIVGHHSFLDTRLFALFGLPGHL
jgi:RNA polymerase sigma-70 factor, ECF subfamily